MTVTQYCPEWGLSLSVCYLPAAVQGSLEQSLRTKLVFSVYQTKVYLEFFSFNFGFLLSGMPELVMLSERYVSVLMHSAERDFFLKIFIREFNLFIKQEHVNCYLLFFFRFYLLI